MLVMPVGGSDRITGTARLTPSVPLKKHGEPLSLILNTKGETALILDQLSGHGQLLTI